MADDDLEARHRALIERDRIVGLHAEAESARARADRLQAALDVAQQRLDRKNVRIKTLVARVAELEVASATAPGGLRGLLTRVGRRVGQRVD